MRGEAFIGKAKRDMEVTLGLEDQRRGWLSSARRGGLESDGEDVTQFMNWMTECRSGIATTKKIKFIIKMNLTYDLSDEGR